MNEGWYPRFNGDVDGRRVSVFVADSGEIRVETTQLDTEISEGIYEQGSTLLPSVINAGDPIEIEARDADELARELKDIGFSSKGIQEIIRLVIEP